MCTKLLPSSHVVLLHTPAKDAQCRSSVHKVSKGTRCMAWQIQQRACSGEGTLHGRGCSLALPRDGCAKLGFGVVSVPLQRWFVSGAPGCAWSKCLQYTHIALDTQALDTLYLSSACCTCLDARHCHGLIRRGASFGIMEILSCLLLTKHTSSEKLYLQVDVAVHVYSQLHTIVHVTDCVMHQAHRSTTSCC